jgi:hypothetical protein
MRREDLLHVVHAAATITGEAEIVVIGSQSILGSHPSPPASMLRSIEADLFPLNAPGKAADIDAAIGDGSTFHGTFGYYAHGVAPGTAKPPRGWQRRLVRVTVPRRPASSVDAVALCLEAHDLILAKLVANRPRDWEFARDALAAGLVNGEVLRVRVADLPVADDLLTLISASLGALLAGDAG